MKLGRATSAGIAGTPNPGALTMQWLHLQGQPAPGAARKGLVYRHAEGIPIINLESGLDAEGYRRLLRGDFDARLADIRSMLPGNAAIRWDPEMNAKPNTWRTWGRMDPEMYVDGFQYVACRLDSAMLWCPVGSGKGNLERLPDYYPGDFYTDFVGFDRYDLGTRRPMRKMFARPLGMLQDLAPDKRVIVAETGSLRIKGHGGRTKWLRSLEELEGVWGLNYFDLDMENEGRDWRMNRSMLRHWERMGGR